MTNAHSTLMKMEENLSRDAAIQKLNNLLETFRCIQDIYQGGKGEIRLMWCRGEKSHIRKVIESLCQVLDAMRNESFDFILSQDFQYPGVIMICEDANMTKELCKTNIIECIDLVQLATAHDTTWLDGRDRTALFPASSDLLFFDIKDNCQKTVKELIYVKANYIYHEFCCVDDVYLNEDYDDMRKDFLQKLRDAGLWTNEDRIKYKPFVSCYQPGCKERVEYFLQLCPEWLPLRETSFGELPIHISIKESCPRCERNEEATNSPASTESFELVLRAGIEHYPEKLGFLFEENRYGLVALTKAVERFGKDTVFKIIGEYDLPRIGSVRGFSFLYHVFTFTPKVADDIIDLYPWATEVPTSHKNENGDFITGGYFPDHLTVGLQRGGVVLSPSNFEKVYNKQVLDEKDPVTGLYLFMISASDIAADKNSLTTAFKLLKMSPNPLISSIPGL